MSKKRGNKKGKNADDDFEDTQSLTSEKDNLTSKPAKGKSTKKGKKGKKDDWSDDEVNEESKLRIMDIPIYLIIKNVSRSVSSE